ncbi:MAG: hypothetical protein Q9224_002880 [Gallowayella concinna]
MADPFSIVAGTAGVLDICWRVGSYLAKIKTSAIKIERDLAALLFETNALIAANESIQALWGAYNEETLDKSITESQRIADLWQDINITLNGCHDVMSRLALLIEEVIGKDGFAAQGKRDGIKKVLRKQSRDDEIMEIRSQISSHQNSLQLSLSALNICYIRITQSSTDAGLSHLSDRMEFWGFKLNHEVAAINAKISLRCKSEAKSPTSSTAAGIASEMKLNKHFYIPRAVSSIFTGRTNLLDDLQSCIFDASTPSEKDHIQKRFVIYGLGGSGKTEFCCKFAQDNRQSFWGVFWINASSRQSVQHTYSTIAQVGGVEPNERAAKDWLANLDRPWLLLVDNADDPHTSLEEHFPQGDRGVILVTTRNPLNRVHGTVGVGSYHFERLGEAEANDLLLRVACEPMPWSTTVRDLATKITSHLGFLALAVLQAGKAIAKRFCTLSNYIEIYDRSWSRIRRLRRQSDQIGSRELTVSMNVYSSYEIIFRGLEATESVTTRDAVQLIKMFSFFSWEDLRIDVLTASVEHPRRQATKDQAEAAKPSTKAIVKPQTWRQLVTEWITWAVIAFQRDQTDSVLPAVLRDCNQAFDEDRLMDALDQLNQLSLIYYQDVTGSYTMHPLIHTWVRERPQMSTSEQCLWCQAAITTLARSILLPPLDCIESAEALRRHLIPHINYALRYQKSTQQAIVQNLKARRLSWLTTRSEFGRNQALESAKFSLIYVKNGYFNEAEDLQVKTRDFVCSRLGLEHATARRITLFLAVTYGLQTRNNKAAELQEQVFEACKNHLGPDHLETLEVMNTLGASRRFQGRFREGRSLLERAIERMTNILGPDHEYTLQATDDLGRLLWMCLEYTTAREHHAKAVDGLTKVLGALHEKTLIAKENLAMACLSFTGEILIDEPNPHSLMIEVLEERRRKFGKEHPWTLYAILNFARVKSALGDHEEAKTMIKTAVPIARRDLGENHYGTLAGKAHLAQILVRQSRFAEAEDILNNVIQQERFASAARDDGEHPDRIAYLWFLINCYQKHGKVDDALRVSDELLEAISTIGGQGLGLLHPFAKQLQERRKELKVLKGTASDQGMVAA